MLLRHAISCYVEHDPLERPQQGIGTGGSRAFQNPPRAWFCGSSDLAVYSVITTEMQLEALRRVLEQDGTAWRVLAAPSSPVICY